MKNLILFSTAVCAFFLVTSCEKDPVVDNTTALPNGDMLSAFKTSKEAGATQTFTVSATTGDTVVGSQGTIIVIAPGSLYGNAAGTGTPLTGSVVVTLVEIYTVKDMAFMNKPSMGEVKEDTLSAMVSGGEYYLKITQNNNTVYAPTGVSVYLPVENTGGALPAMMQYDGEIANGNIAWIPTTTPVSVVQVPTEAVGGTAGEFISCYQIADKKWGWTSAAFYMAVPGTTIVKAKLPVGFNPTNTELYISYDGAPLLLGAMDTYTTDGKFSEKFGLVPIGTSVHFVAVTYLDGQLHYAIQASTIEDEHVEEIPKFYPTTQAELTTLINGLP